MTVAELKKLLEQFDDDLIVEVKNDYGEYDLATVVSEEEELYCVTSEYEECIKLKRCSLAHKKSCKYLLKKGVDKSQLLCYNRLIKRKEEIK